MQTLPTFEALGTLECTSVIVMDGEKPERRRCLGDTSWVRCEQAGSVKLL